MNDKRLEQKLPEGIFATCSHLRKNDHWCTKYNNDALYNQGEYNYEKYCLSHGGCDGEYSYR